ncbi:MAG: hypothetical protein ACTSRA_00640 [Promethearchaeota archaeon]|nr:MAG: hypothetical protein [Helarchaeota virus Nidhogg Meg22_1012]URC17465.1 MAG: hypothetical protein [Helarchaeota virus Nidhogg Meg22_1214]
MKKKIPNVRKNKWNRYPNELIYHSPEEKIMGVLFNSVSKDDMKENPMLYANGDYWGYGTPIKMVLPYDDIKLEKNTAIPSRIRNMVGRIPKDCCNKLEKISVITTTEEDERTFDTLEDAIEYFFTNNPIAFGKSFIETLEELDKDIYDQNA